MSFFTLSNVTKRFGSVEALSNVSISVEEGESVILLGPSGCGKTTCLRLAAGFERSDAGEISVGGSTLASDRVFVPPDKRRMSVVFQTYALWPHMTVFDNVAFGPKVSGDESSSIRDRVSETLELVQLGGFEDRYPHQLSGGQQQRVALARALITRPQILLLDEPLSNLDTRLREEMRSEIKRLQRLLGVTMIYVTHDQAEALSLADRIIVMNAGSIEQSGTPEQVYRRPRNRFVANALGAVNLIEADITSRNGAEARVRILGDYEVEVDAPDSAIGETKPRVMVSIRPADIKLQDHMTAADDLPRAIVNEVQFLGDLTRYSVEVQNSGQKLHITDQGMARYESGQSVALSVVDDAATILEGELQEESGHLAGDRR